jgi:SWIM zinc finger
MKREETQEDLSVVGTGVLANENGFYLVPSANDPTRYYVVEQHPTHLSCTCKDHFYRGRRCKHIAAVVAHKQRVQLAVARQSLEEVQCDLVEMNASATTRFTCAGRVWREERPPATPAAVATQPDAAL